VIRDDRAMIGPLGEGPDKVTNVTGVTHYKDTDSERGSASHR